MQKKSRLIKILIEGGVEVDAVDKKGRTALAVLAGRGCGEDIELHWDEIMRDGQEERGGGSGKERSEDIDGGDGPENAATNDQTDVESEGEIGDAGGGGDGDVWGDYDEDIDNEDGRDDDGDEEYSEWADLERQSDPKHVEKYGTKCAMILLAAGADVGKAMKALKVEISKENPMMKPGQIAKAMKKLRGWESEFKRTDEKETPD